MFNFNLINEAFGDERITPTQFKLLYLIVNNCSMNNTTTIKMFNGFLADKMGLSVRMMQYNIKQLEDCGYIEVKRTAGRNAAKQPNEITLLDTSKNSAINSAINCALYETDKETIQLNCAIDCTPYNTRKRNKNISVCTSTGTHADEDTDTNDTMNISEQVEDSIIVSGSEYEDGTCGDNDNISIEVNAAGTNPQVKLSKDEITRRNDYISTVYRRLDTKFDFLYSLKTYSLYVDEVNTIAKIITEAQGHSDWFTQKQWDKLTWYCERFVKITEVKDNYFNGGTKKNADADTVSMDEENTSAYNDGSIDSPSDNGGCAPQKCRPFTKEEAVAWAEKTVTQYDSFRSWDETITAKFNTKYGDGWDWGKDPNACRLYNIASSVADKYFKSLEYPIDNTPTPTEENTPTDYAPWETPLNTLAEPDCEDYKFDEYISAECSKVA